MCILWWGPKKVGDDFTPEVYEYVVTFNIPDYATGKAGYIQMNTFGVNNKHNDIYLNGKKVWHLLNMGDRWGFDGILIQPQFLNKGQNTFKITARNAMGTTSGNIDDYWVSCPVLFYPIA